VIRHPIVILVLLTGLNLLNYLDRFVLSAVLPKIEEDLHMTRLVEGSLATVFLIGYFATSPFFGMVGDRGKRTRWIAAGVAVWSLATVASGLAAGQWSLIASRVVVGVGEASYATIAPTLIDDLAPRDKKGKWLAIFYAAMPIGSALGFFTGGFVGSHHGWRAAFFVAGGPGLLLALHCLLIAEPERHTASARPKENMWAIAKELFPLPVYRRTVLGYCAFTFAMGGFAFWAPSFLVHTYGLDLKPANFYFGAITVVTGAIGTFVGGVLGDRAAQKDRGHPDADTNRALGYLWICSLCTAVGAPLAALCFTAESSGNFFTFAAPCQVALFISTSPINAAILRSVPEHRRASAMALSIFAIHLLGDLWSPPLIGSLADHIAMRWAMFLVPFAFAVAAIIWWVPPVRNASAEGTK